ncbi:hypothetical protein N2152v2_006249 [Parachlorella kessleri]
MYNLRKRKAVAASLKPAPVIPREPAVRGLAASTPSSFPADTALDSTDPAPESTAQESAAAVVLDDSIPENLATPAAVIAAEAVAESPAPSAPKRKGKKWEDVGLKVDTSRFLLGVGTPPPLLDAALVPSQATASQPLATQGFTLELLQQACQHLATADQKLVPFVEQHGAPERLLAKTGTSCFASLAKSIVFQQLATGAAAAIYARVLGVCKCEEELTVEALEAASYEELRGSGLSDRKVSYLLDLCRHFREGQLSEELIAGWDDATLQECLTKVKGIGPWTCDMFAMFHLGHPDVLPVGDLGVRRGMQVLYDLKDLPDAGAMERIAEPWRPFRSVGCYYMWRVEVSRSLGRATKTKNKSETTKAKKGTGKTAKAKKEPGKASGESREPL